MSPAPRPDPDEGWVEHGGTISFKWADRQPGEQWVGTWLGREAGGKYGERGMLDVGTEVLKLGLPNALESRTQNIPAGTKIKIVYLGMQKSAAGNSFHAFRVLTAKADAVFLAGGAPSAPPSRTAVPPARSAAPAKRTDPQDDDDVNF